MKVANKSSSVVLLVDNHDLADKEYVHQVGLKHYAYSVFIFNVRGDLLLQKRAENKYHSGGLWTNTCCSHPVSHEVDKVKLSAEQRLQEEMGIMCDTEYLFTFEYKKTCGGLIENEVDFVFAGVSDKHPTIDTNEASDYKWMSLPDILADVKDNPEKYTEWFIILMSEHYHRLVNFINASNSGS